MEKIAKMLVAVDIVVFSAIKGRLQVLLIRRKNPPFRNSYALPGGFVEERENLEEAALRELHEETGVKDIFIKKLTAYGDVGRDPRGRIVTVAFLAFIDSEKFRLEGKGDSLEAEWKPISDVKQLAFDHMKILNDALVELRYDIQTTNIAAQLLPEKFTLAELQNLYEIVLGVQLDKRNFRKRISGLKILKPTRETRMEGAHRPAQLFKFKERDYKPIKEKMHVFI